VFLRRGKGKAREAESNAGDSFIKELKKGDGDLGQIRYQQLLRPLEKRKKVGWGKRRGGGESVSDRK